MTSLGGIVKKIIDLHRSGGNPFTLLAVCPNSSAVLEAAVISAARKRTPMLFAATLNQVDIDGGYTGWTPENFITQLKTYASQINWNGPLFACLDHGGPWLKDKHTADRLSLGETMHLVKESIAACITAGYHLLHIDPTIDRSLPLKETIPLELVISRTVELISFAEQFRSSRGLPFVAYEVGSEEVHGGLVDIDRFQSFVHSLRASLTENNLLDFWPIFFVAQVGTDLHTTYFDPLIARHLFDILSPLGSLVKGHYTDWVESPDLYPKSGMGGANVGPEFTSEEFIALEALAAQEISLTQKGQILHPSNFIQNLQEAVILSNRWRKWLQPDETGLNFVQLPAYRQRWLTMTGARYVWTAPRVVESRRQLYTNLSPFIQNPHQRVVDRISTSIDHYIQAFNLPNTIDIL